MLGPDRSVHGGISGVVNGWYEAGIDKDIELRYIATMREGSKLTKLFTAFGAYLEFGRCLKEYELVHANMASDSSYLRKSVFIKKAFKKGKKIVIHQHGGEWIEYYKSLSEKKKQRVKDIFNMADRVLVLSPFHEDLFKNRIGIDAPITLFPNRISIPDEITPIEHDGIRLLFLGRICRDKGIDELLEGVAEARKTYPDIHLCLGGIIEEAVYKEKIEKSDSFVSCLGWIGGKQKAEELRKCDIFIMPSYFEGQNVSVMEAMAFGRPVIATDVGGTPMMIKDHETGILIEHQSAKAVSDAICELLSDDSLRANLGMKAREKAESDYNINRVVSDLRTVYEEILSRK